MKRVRFLSLVLSIAFIFGSLCSTSALDIKEVNMDIKAKSAILMDVNTGTILFEKNMHEALPPASVTKIMTLLLVFESIEDGKIKYEDILTVSEYAASMGGSQVFLEPGEEMSVDELIKCVVVSSANDAAVTLAEAVGGSEEAFVQMMNERAKELGMSDTNFENVTGLDDDVTNHLTSAHDIALMSKELLKHEKVTDYTTIWMDTIRNGEFGLSNTNRLVKYFKGSTGLKTGYTRGAGFCISASALRGGLHLVAVIMGAETSNIRNIEASKLLEFGFANYCIYDDAREECGKIKIINGVKDEIGVYHNSMSLLENIGNNRKVTKETVIFEDVCAPVKKGDCVGEIIYKIDGKVIAKSEILVSEDVSKLSYFQYLLRVFKNFILS